MATLKRGRKAFMRAAASPCKTIQVSRHLIEMASKPSYSYGALRFGLGSCTVCIRMIKRYKVG